MIQLLAPGGLVASVIALLIGLLILAFPRLLNYFVALYLILIGLIGILAAFGARTP